MNTCPCSACVSMRRTEQAFQYETERLQVEDVDVRKQEVVTITLSLESAEALYRYYPAEDRPHEMELEAALSVALEEADKSGSGTCANPGLSTPIVSTPIVSTTASALRSAPISGYIADAPISGYIAGGYTACKHGFTPECTFCWNERRRLNGQSTVDTAEPYRNQYASDITTTVAIQADEQTMSTDSASDHYERGVVTDTDSTATTVTTYAPATTGVTIPRWLAACIVDVDFPPEVWLLAARTICQAALEGER